MTTHKHLKARVRTRMQKTGESFAAARAHVVAAGEAAVPAMAASTVAVNGVRHLPGVHPETTAVRILATHAGIAGLTEEAVLAAGGGLGAGVFAFHYAREGFSSLFLAGRRDWQDSRGFVERAAANLGLHVNVVETGSTRTADRGLRSALERGPVAAWVDAAELGYRGLPPEYAGGAYHVLVVYDTDGDDAIIGDLAPAPIRIPLETLARSRARIRAHRHRLLSVAPRSITAPRAPDIGEAMRNGLRAGADGLATEPRRNFSLRAFDELAGRMESTTGAESWSRVFSRGRLLWLGLSSLHRYIETYSTGGGLMRPMGARALRELAERSGDPRLGPVAARYEALGRGWSDLAVAALPDDVPLLAQTRRLQSPPGNRAEAWTGLAELERSAAKAFPLAEEAAIALRRDLAGRLRGLHAGEVAALAELRAVLAG